MKTILLFILLFSNQLFAQFKLGKSYAIYVNYPEYSVKANVLNSNEKIKSKSDLTYFWYSANKIKETQGGFEGRVLDGLFSSFYKSTNLKERGSFKNGLKAGEWIYWSEAGKIQRVDNWNKGLKSGVSKTYTKEGELQSLSKFKADKLHGKSLVFKDGKVEEENKYKNGNLILPKEHPKMDSLKMKVADIFHKSDKEEKKQKKQKPLKVNEKQVKGQENELMDRVRSSKENDDKNDKKEKVAKSKKPKIKKEKVSKPKKTKSETK